MLKRTLYIFAMSITLLLSYGVYCIMSDYAANNSASFVSGYNHDIIDTAKGVACTFTLFAACEFLIQLAGLSLDFPFVTKRISRIMFDILIFLRFISVFPIIDFNVDDVAIIYYNLFSLIPLIIILITEKKQAGETPKQGVMPVLIISVLYIVSSLITGSPNAFIVFDANINYDLRLIVTMIIGIIVNLIIADAYIKNKQNGGSPLLTAVSLFIVTTPPIFILMLFLLIVFLL
jgi:hypothetical protein